MATKSKKYLTTRNRSKGLKKKGGGGGGRDDDADGREGGIRTRDTPFARSTLPSSLYMSVRTKNTGLARREHDAEKPPAQVDQRDAVAVR